MNHPLTGSEANLIAYWNFDEGAGDVAHDSTTNSYDGTLNGPQWISSTIPRQTTLTLVNPARDGQDFTFFFPTVTNTGYAVEYNDDLGTTNWQFLESMTGDGSLMPCLVPMTNAAHRFFRVHQP